MPGSDRSIRLVCAAFGLWAPKAAHGGQALASDRSGVVDSPALDAVTSLMLDGCLATKRPEAPTGCCVPGLLASRVW